jgi:outer membrane immunogenic protein
MKKTSFVAVAIAILFAPGAFAADLAVPRYTKAPPMVDPRYDWSGFYAGLNVGNGWGSSSTTSNFNDATSGGLLSSSAGKFDMNGAIGGGQIGYNWQQANWVFGIEADIQASGQRGSASAACAGASATLNGACTLGHLGGAIQEGDVEVDDAGLPVTSSLNQKLKWFGTARARLGTTITPSILLYATGGLAYGEISTTETVNGVNISGVPGQNGATQTPVSATFSNSETKVGWTAGAGIEGALGGNWTAKLEYLYLDLGTTSGSFTTPIVAPSGGFLATGYSSHFTDNILRVGVNYRFGGSTLAKY